MTVVIEVEYYSDKRLHRVVKLLEDKGFKQNHVYGNPWVEGGTKVMIKGFIEKDAGGWGLKNIKDVVDVVQVFIVS